MLTSHLLSELEIIAHRGAETANISLSTFLNVKLTLSVNSVELSDIAVIPEKTGNSEKIAIGLIVQVNGEIKGNAALLFNVEDAYKLVSLLGNTKIKSINEELNELERSMLEETANITISSFMNSITAHLGQQCIPNAPLFLKDMAGSILSVMLMESAEVSDQAVIFSTKFISEQKDISALFTFLPSPSSLKILGKGLVDG